MLKTSLSGAKFTESSWNWSSYSRTEQKEWLENSLKVNSQHPTDVLILKVELRFRNVHKIAPYISEKKKQAPGVLMLVGNRIYFIKYQNKIK